MKKSKTIALHIPKPCHQNWENMSPTEQGRYCHSCKKEVVSFANKSDAQIVEYFKNAPKKVCGKFRSEQLRTYTLPQQSLVSPRFRALTIGSLLSALTVAAVYGKQDCQPQQLFEFPISEAEIQSMFVLEPTTSDTIHSVLGQITDLRTGKALPNVTIQIKETSYLTTTNSDGDFSLNVPDEYREKPFTVIVFASSYEKQEYTIIPDQLPTTLHVQLVANYVPHKEMNGTMGEVEFIMGRIAAPQK